jgi:CHRD domain
MGTQFFSYRAFDRFYSVFVAALAIGVFALLAGCAGSDGDTAVAGSPLSFSVSLSGAQQSPPALTAAGGSGVFALQPLGAFTGTVNVTGLTATAARLHIGGIGVNGAATLSLTESPAGSGNWSVPANTTFTAEQRAAIVAGDMYVNVVSAAFPNGQLRGQIGRTVRTANLTGAQENPPVTTNASGVGIVSVDPVTRALTARVVTTGVVGTVAHIHTAAVGTNGSVIVNLTETPVGSGIWLSAAGATLTEQQYSDLLSGNLYFNVHSAANPSGEVRGQIGMLVIDAVMVGTQEVPPNASAARGRGRVVLDLQTLNLTGSMVTTGMTGTVAHIHTGVFGANGGVTFNFTQSAAGSGVWSMPVTQMTTAQYQSLLFGDMYFNAHSATFPSGEVRGQIGNVVRTATLSGTQEVPPNNSTGTGRGIGIYNPATGAASFVVTTSVGNATAAHIHTGAIGANGGVTVGFTQTSPGVWTSAATASFTAGQAATFAAGGMYFNVHSAAFPGGEVRGQANGRD